MAFPFERTSGYVDEARFESDAEVFRKCIAQVGFALRLLQEFERPHFGAAIGAGADLRRAAQFELAETGIAIAAGNEQRPDQRVDFRGDRSELRGRRRVRRYGAAQGVAAVRDFQIGLAAITPRHAGSRRYIAKAHAAGLAAARFDGAGEDAVRRRQREAADAAEEAAAQQVERGLRRIDAEVGRARLVADDAVADFKFVNRIRHADRRAYRTIDRHGEMLVAAG